jgi:hypothetical protein
MANVEGVDYNIREINVHFKKAMAGDLDSLAYLFNLKALAGTATRKSYQLGVDYPIPLTSFTAADGTPLIKFASEDQATFGLNLADSESLCLRWNNHASPGTVLCEVHLPSDLDADTDLTLNFLCSKSGATDADDTVLTIAAYVIASGALHDSDANCGGATGALVGTATAKTTATLSRTIAAADIPTGATRMSFSVTPSLLGTDDLLVHDVWYTFTRKPNIGV